MKTWKIFGLLALLVCASATLHAQDVVRLKNGSIIRGSIIEYLAGDHVRIKTEEGKVYEYSAADILSADAGQAAQGRVPKLIVPKTKGFYSISGIGMALGNRYGYLQGSPSFYTVNGWQCTPHLFTGLGLAIESMNGAAQLPITADVRWKFGKGNVNPYLGAQVGYTLVGRSPYDYYWGDGGSRNHGGPTTGAQVGFMAQLGQHFGLTAAMGYRFQMLTRDYDMPYWMNNTYVYAPVTERTYMHRATLSLGVMFN